MYIGYLQIQSTKMIYEKHILYSSTRYFVYITKKCENLPYIECVFDKLFLNRNTDLSGFTQTVRRCFATKQL